MNLDEKLQLYFFDPKKDEVEYHAEYKKLSGSVIVAYSPLYLLRRQMLFLSGEIPGIKKSIYHKTYLSAIIISNIAVSGLAEIIYCKEKIKPEQYKQFYETYLGKDAMQMLGLRALRNGLEHNNFQLYTRVYKNNENNTGGMFKELIGYLSQSPEWNGIWRMEKRLVDFIKITFALSKSKEWNIVSKPEIQNFYKEEKYLLVQYKINPFRYIERLENGIEMIKGEIISSPRLTNHFSKKITVDNWMKVYSA
ncbi:MAG: hypothetical protein OEV37_03380 [Candidatus Berkelbacteria bacterium]|nr:hypothetical protein [Candidatus Berkelbacteria bacterium]